MFSTKLSYSYNNSYTCSLLFVIQTITSSFIFQFFIICNFKCCIVQKSLSLALTLFITYLSYVICYDSFSCFWVSFQRDQVQVSSSGFPCQYLPMKIASLLMRKSDTIHQSKLRSVLERSPIMNVTHAR